MSALKTWLGELQLSGYGVDTIMGQKRILRKDGRIVWVEVVPGGYKVAITYRYTRTENKFDSFDDMADWVNEKLREP